MPPEIGFQSDALQVALKDALAGRPAELERLLCRAGAVVTAKPNLKLAQAFGAEMAGLKGVTAPLLTRLTREDAAPDTDRAFLPIAAAHGWAGRIRARREVEPAWAALFELAADERAPVRRGVHEALLPLAARPRRGRSQPSGADQLIARAAAWLDEEDRETRFGAAAVAVAVLADRRVLSAVVDTEAMLAYLSRLIAEVAGAPRASERSDARRRLLQALPATLAAVAAVLRVGDRGALWLEQECAAARHPDVRGALSDAVIALRSQPAGASGEAPAQRLREVLKASAKPPRDPTRIRPGTGRGKASRRIS